MHTTISPTTIHETEVNLAETNQKFIPNTLNPAP